MCCAQGAATTIYAATAPELDGHSGAYLVDCAIAKPAARAENEEEQKKLWEVRLCELRIWTWGARGGGQGRNITNSLEQGSVL